MKNEIYIGCTFFCNFAFKFDGSYQIVKTNVQQSSLAAFELRIQILVPFKPLLIDVWSLFNSLGNCLLLSFHLKTQYKHFQSLIFSAKVKTHKAIEDLKKVILTFDKILRFLLDHFW